MKLNPQLENYWGLQKSVFDDQRLSDTAKLICLLMIHFENSSSNFCRGRESRGFVAIRLKEISQRLGPLGPCEKSVSRAMKQLVESGWVLKHGTQINLQTGTQESVYEIPPLKHMLRDEPQPVFALYK